MDRIHTNKKPDEGQTLGQFLDFDEQVRRGEIEGLSSSESQIFPGHIKSVKMDNAVGQTRQAPLPSLRKDGQRGTSTTNYPPVPAASLALDDDSSSDSDSEKSGYLSRFRTCTINQIKTPNSIATSVSARSISSSGGSCTTSSSDDSPAQGCYQSMAATRIPGPKPDFSSLYYPKAPPILTGVAGRGRGRGRGIGLASSYLLQQDSSSNEIVVDVSTSSDFKSKSTKREELDSDDSEPDDKPSYNILKNRSAIVNKPAPVSKPAFSPKKLIDKPEKITKHSDSKPLDFPGRLLTRGPLLVSPLGAINHFAYYKLLVKGIKNCGIDEFNSLQKSVAPHLLRTDDCFITGGVGSGKTLSYLIPMVGKLLAETSDDSSPAAQQNKNENTGKPIVENNYAHQPSAIIVCSDKRSATKIDGHLFSLLSAGNQRQLSYALLCEGKDRRNARRGVDIIITSVQFFSNLLKTASLYLGFEKLRFFVFEDVDVLSRAFRQDFDDIQEALFHIVSKHSRFFTQRVFCGKEWCPEVEDLYMSLESLQGCQSSPSIPTVFINSPNQVIKYSGMKWIMHHCVDHEKIEFLISLLKSDDLFKHKSIFVLCSTAEIAMMVHHELAQNDVYACLAESANMTQATIPLVKNEWEDFPSQQRIMVLNDAMLRGLNIYDVTCLINYDMPSKIGAYIKSSSGADRYFCMWANFRNIAKEKVDPTCKSQRVELAAHFLLTGEETILHKLRSFSSNLACEIPQSLIAIADQMDKDANQKLPICGGIKEFGRCVESVASNCKCRHDFLMSDLEKETVVPRNGEIEVRISECINPTTYTAQVLRCFESKDGKQILRWSWIQNYRSISDQLKQHFQTEKNRIPPKSFDVGSLCAIENSDGIFRARILQILTRTELNYPKQLRVFCIDSGYYLQPSAENLLCLPDNLQALRQLAIELILSNLQPLEGENGYGSVARSKAKDLTLEQILTGKVQFAMGETVWVNPLVDVGLDAVDGSIKTRSSIRLKLIDLKCAENNNTHLSNILDLCRKTGFKCPELDEAQAVTLIKDMSLMSKFHDIGDDYQWAFVTTCRIENPETVEFWMSLTKNPHCIFGTNGKFDNELTAVTCELDDSISELIGDRCADYATQFASYYQKGMVVAVKERVENCWHRGLIINAHEDEINGETLYDVFLVDIGDEQKDSKPSELFPIFRKLVEKLPFQAISFELAHIRPTSGETWSDIAIDGLRDLTIDSDENAVMFDVVALQTRKHTSLPCRCYSAFLILRNGDDVGEALVGKGLASYTKDDKELKLVKQKILISFNDIYNMKLKADNDDDSSDELENDLEKFDSDDSELDVVGFDRNTVLNAFGINLPGGVQLPSSALNESDGKPHPTAASITKPDQNAVAGSSGVTPTQNGEQTSNLKDALPTTPFSNLKHPTVYWRQTSTLFVLKIAQVDIRDYTLEIDKKKISFRTQLPPNYGFDVEVFGTIDKTPTVFCTGQYLKITLKKRTKWPWPRPLHQQEKVRWLKEDIDQIELSDDEEDPSDHSVVLPEAGESDSESDGDVDGNYMGIEGESD